ncbi:hypothetical protein chiPu_0029458, partial [Chiloscyllium punctatum]|nr:hypothetical protein [Chiloscyllium punctatum]
MDDLFVIGVKLRRIERPDRRQIAVEALDLNRRQLPGAALREGGRADIARQHVGIAVNAERRLVLGVHRIVPGAGRQLHHAGGDAVGDMHRGKAGAARVEDADDVAVGDPARRSVARIHARDLAAAMLGLNRMAAEIELAVQPRHRLVGDQEARRIRCRRVRLREPDRMARAIRIAMTGDLLREDLDAAARCR